jgi:chemotaxis protein CheX
MPEALDREKIVAAVSAATAEVFSTMLTMEMVAQESFAQASTPAPSDGVVTLIGLAGKWVGTGSICCTPELARKISGQLLMSECASVDQEVLDAMGEVTNMIIGNFKNTLEPDAGPLTLGIPVVIFGHNFMASSVHAADWVVVPFVSDTERMEVKICLAPHTQPQNRRSTNVRMHL